MRLLHGVGWRINFSTWGSSCSSILNSCVMSPKFSELQFPVWNQGAENTKAINICAATNIDVVVYQKSSLHGIVNIRYNVYMLYVYARGHTHAHTHTRQVEITSTH